MVLELTSGWCWSALSNVAIHGNWCAHNAPSSFHNLELLTDVDAPTPTDVEEQHWARLLGQTESGCDLHSQLIQEPDCDTPAEIANKGNNRTSGCWANHNSHQPQHRIGTSNFQEH